MLTIKPRVIECIRIIKHTVCSTLDNYYFDLNRGGVLQLEDTNVQCVYVEK